MMAEHFILFIEELPREWPPEMLMTQEKVEAMLETLGKTDPANCPVIVIDSLARS